MLARGLRNFTLGYVRKEDLRDHIQKIAKQIGSTFPLPSLLFPDSFASTKNKAILESEQGSAVWDICVKIDEVQEQIEELEALSSTTTGEFFKKEQVLREYRKEKSNFLKQLDEARPGLGIVSSEKDRMIKKLMDDAEPEIEMLYQVVKDTGLTGGASEDGNVDSQRWKEATSNFFDENPKSFQMVRREYLKDGKLFSLTPDHERRDFIGWLLRLILEDKGIPFRSYQKLYSEYRRTRRPTNR